MKITRKKLIWSSIFTLSATFIATSFTTSCLKTNNDSLDLENKNEIGNENVSKEFLKDVNKICNDIKISPKAQYKNLYATKANWPADKITSQYFDGLPSPRDVNMLLGISKILSYNPKDGEMTIELIFQSVNSMDDYTSQIVTISGFAKESGISIMNRLYSPENVNITPKWGESAEDQLAIKSNWSIDKITDKYFDGLPQESNGVEPKIVDVICNDSDLGQLQLKYKFYFNEEEVSTKIYTVDGFAKEDPYIKTERLYGNVNITAKEGAKKFSAIGSIWTPNKITSSWFNGLPKSQEGVEVSLKEVITNADLESQGALQLVYTYSKNGASVERTYEVDGFYKDEDVAASNLYVASKAYKNLKLNKNIDASKYKLKDIANKKASIINELFDLPKIPYVSMNYEIINWRNWKEGEEKLPAGSFKIKFDLKDDVSGKTQTIISKLFYGFEDVLGQWNEQFVYNRAYEKLVAKNDFISWREFYTGKGKGGSWDYSYNDILPATGQQNAVWLPIVIPDLPANSSVFDKVKFEKRYKKLQSDFKFKTTFQKRVNDLAPDALKFQNYGIQNPTVVRDFYRFVDETPSNPHIALEKMKDNLKPEDFGQFKSKFFNFHIGKTDSIRSLIQHLVDNGVEPTKTINKLLGAKKIKLELSDGTIVEIPDMEWAIEKITKELKKTVNDIRVEIKGLRLVAEVFLDAILPMDITLLPLLESKAYLPVLGDYFGEYRYTKATAESDAIHAFGFEKPNRSRFDNFVTYDLKNSNSLSSKDYENKSEKGATEALRRYVLKNYYDKDKKQLKFDNIKYVSYEGTDEIKKLPNGFENGMGHTDAYWFSCNYIYEVNYDGESLKIPFTMRLGAFDGLEIDSQFVIGDDSDLEGKNYKIWK